MKRLFIVAALAAFSTGLAATAMANYVWPGHVIVGTGIWGGYSASANATMDGCEIAGLECECFAGMPLLEACMHNGVSVGCLAPHMPYKELIQKEPVLLADGSSTLAGLMCSGKSDQTAIVNLPPGLPLVP